MTAFEVNFDGLINGVTRLKYIREYGYNFWPYLDEAQKVDVYFDVISEGAADSYDAKFKSRGYRQYDIMAVIERQYGKSIFPGRLRMYIRPELIRYLPAEH